MFLTNTILSVSLVVIDINFVDAAMMSQMFRMFAFVNFVHYTTYDIE